MMYLLIYLGKKFGEDIMMYLIIYLRKKFEEGV